MNKLLAIALAALSLATQGMPTKAQLDEVKPIVQELMAPLVKDYNAKRKLASEVADGAMALVAEADTEAAKFALIRGAVAYYARAKAYDKAADAIESLVRHIPDIPAPTLYEITSKAAANTTARTAPRLAALNAAAKKRAAVAARRASVAKELRKTPADLRLLRLDAELAAASGDWDAALAQFAKLGGDTARIAAADADATGSDAEIADFWWNYAPAAPEAKDAIRAHAANLYRRAIDSGALDGLKRTLAEKRIAEVDATDTNAQKVEYKFNYRVDNNGNAILFSKDRLPCATPAPAGNFVCPATIDGHKVTGIDEYAFMSGCEQMKKCVLPQFLKDGNGQMFWNCPGLATIEIAKTNPHFTTEKGVLYSKDKRTMIAYPKTRGEIKLARETKRIRTNSFQTCSFTIGKFEDGIESIDPYGFSGCVNVEVLEFPKTLKWIGHNAFEYCPKLQKIIFHGDAPNVANLFGGNGRSGNIVIEVQRGSKGWTGPGRTDLPERWPLNGISHPIRYIK